MSGQEPSGESFDSDLRAMFNRKAAALPDAGFSAATLRALERRARTRAIALGAAGGLGALIAASQFRPASELIAGKLAELSSGFVTLAPGAGALTGPYAASLLGMVLLGLAALVGLNAASR